MVFELETKQNCVTKRI